MSSGKVNFSYYKQPILIIITLIQVIIMLYYFKIENLIIKKCEKCGSTIRVLNDSNTISCCGEDMKTLTPQYEDNNSHVPNLVKKDRTLYITMDHVMEENHYIKNIFIIRENEVIEYKFNIEEILNLF